MSPEPKPAVVTDEHKLLALAAHQAKHPQQFDAAAQLIADAQARAVEEALTIAGFEKQIEAEVATRDDWAKLIAERDQLRAEVKTKEDVINCLALSEKTLIEGLDQLRAEVKRLTGVAFDKDGTPWKTICESWSAKYDAAERQMRENVERAERAEAQLHALRLVCGTTDANKFQTWVDRANERAEKAEAEAAEQARLNGMGSEREARLLAQVEELRKTNGNLVHALKFIEDHVGKKLETEIGEVFYNASWAAEQAQAAINSYNASHTASQ